MRPVADDVVDGPLAEARDAVRWRIGGAPVDSSPEVDPQVPAMTEPTRVPGGEPVEDLQFSPVRVQPRATAAHRVVPRRFDQRLRCTSLVGTDALRAGSAAESASAARPSPPTGVRGAAASRLPAQLLFQLILMASLTHSSRQPLASASAHQTTYWLPGMEVLLNRAWNSRSPAAPVIW